MLREFKSDRVAAAPFGNRLLELPLVCGLSVAEAPLSKARPAKPPGGSDAAHRCDGGDPRLGVPKVRRVVRLRRLARDAALGFVPVPPSADVAAGGLLGLFGRRANR